MTNVNSKTTDWLISEELQNLLYELVKERSGACIVTFRDPRYSAAAGGYHPVEIMIGVTGDIGYITDFTYVGQGQDVELVKEIDFDFSDATLRHLGMEYWLRPCSQLRSSLPATYGCGFSMDTSTNTISPHSNRLVWQSLGLHCLLNLLLTDPRISLFLEHVPGRP